ncbi:MAG: DUF3137 domain-containing protein [Clostridia bacterium]|nr:DUF3137 domain-containing protein [Clostridia bacterium]
MKRTYLSIIVIAAVVLFLAFLQNFNWIELVIQQNKIIQIFFYIVIAAVMSFLLLSHVKKYTDNNLYKTNIKKIKTTEDFDNIYRELKKAFEEVFSQTKRKMLISAGGLIVSLAIFIVLIISFKNPFSVGNEYNEESALGMIFVIISGIATIVALIYIFKYLKTYNQTYKYGVIGNLVNLINTNFKYGTKNPEIEQFIKKQYINSGFEHEKIDTFLAEDFIIGNIDKNSYLAISDIYVQRDENIEKNENVKVLFKGLFAALTVNKSINSTIKILGDKLKIVLDDDFVKLDSAEMEKNFDVYATNKMLVMRIFTPDMMELINRFYNEFKIRFEIIMNNNMVYFRFHTNDMFETRLIENPFDKEKLFLYYTTLKLVLELTEKFNENLNNLDI